MLCRLLWGLCSHLEWQESEAASSLSRLLTPASETSSSDYLAPKQFSLSELPVIVYYVCPFLSTLSVNISIVITGWVAEHSFEDAVSL